MTTNLSDENDAHVVLKVMDWVEESGSGKVRRDIQDTAAAASLGLSDDISSYLSPDDIEQMIYQYSRNYKITETELMGPVKRAITCTLIVSPSPTHNGFRVNQDDNAVSNETIEGCRKLLDTYFSDYQLDSQYSYNTTMEHKFYVDYTQLHWVVTTLVFFYLLVIISAIVGNVIICHAVATDRKLQTTVNYYIFNLALADFLVGMFVAPAKLLILVAPADWGIFNIILCTTLDFLQAIVVFVSVLTLAAVCYER